MRKATILFYNGDPINPCLKKIIKVKGLSKIEFTGYLCYVAIKICKEQNYESFSIINRIDTIEEVKNDKK